MSADLEKETENKGTLMLDATCASANIRYPQDVSLLNEAREKLETILYRFHKACGLPLTLLYLFRKWDRYGELEVQISA